MTRKYPLLVLSLLLAVWANTCLSQQDPAATQDAKTTTTEDPADAPERCSVYVYRNKTSFHALNPERPYVYVDDKKVGGLGIGKYHCLQLPPGKHIISIKEPILFMPAHTSGSVEVQVTEGNSVYLRYAKEFSGVAVVGPNATVIGNSKLQPATEEQWRSRQ